MKELTLFVYNYREQETYEFLVIDGKVSKKVGTCAGKFKSFEKLVVSHVLPEDLELLLSNVDCDYVYGVKKSDVAKDIHYLYPIEEEK
jgi:hypothetical protein